MSKKKVKKINDFGGLVYSTNPEESFKLDEDTQEILPEDQKLYLSRDKKNRKGKTVTLIESFQGTDEEAKKLTKEIKQLCGTGGVWKQGEIVIQGDFRNKIAQFLIQKGYKVITKGG